MKKNLKVAIFIPTFNAATTLSLVLDKIPKRIKNQVKEIFVVDDESSDNTYLVGIDYKQKSKLSNLNIFYNKKNLGYGGNQQAAYDYCIKKKYDVVVMLHGDCQYNPIYIPNLLKPFYKRDISNLGMVFGSRFGKGENPLAGNMPLYKFLGNKFLTFIENKVLDLNLSEYHSGYRAYNLNNLKKIPFNMCSSDFEFDSQIIVQLKLAGFDILETPIKTFYGTEKSHVKVVPYGLNVLKAMALYLLHKYNIRKVARYDI